MLIPIAAALASLIPLYFGYKTLKPKPKVKLKNGDIVVLKQKFTEKYPQLPTGHPMHIDKIEGDFATVIFMKTKEICTEKVLKEALSKAS